MSYGRNDFSQHTASEGGSEDFWAALNRALKLDGRRIMAKDQRLGRSDSIFINFINLPLGIGDAGGGAEAENNRMMFTISGFDMNDGHAPPPSGKVKVEMTLSALPREYKLRAKSGPPSQVAKYLADFINKVVAEVEPKYTHTKMGSDMNSYSYDRSKSAAKNSPSPLNVVFGDWLKGLCTMLADKAIPKNLKADEVSVHSSGRNYAEVTARGYSLGDLEAVTTISTTLMFQPIVVRAYAFYKDVNMSRQAEQEFSIAYDEDPLKLAQEIERWLKDR